MFIIFGTRGVTYKHQRGDFHCPGCGCSRPYIHKRQRRFFTLYFIPLIPLDLLGEYVECQQCNSTYRLTVLDLDPHAEKRAFEAEVNVALRRVMVQMMLADGVIEASEVDAIRRIYLELTGSELDREVYDATVAEVRGTDHTTLQSLAGMAGTLNDEGKESVIAAAYRVATSDGVFDQSERQLLAAMGHALQMSAAHIRGVVAGLERE